MKIAIIGYGKMGRAVEAIALERGHEIVLRINSANISELTVDVLKLADLAIEFTKPSSAIHNIMLCFDAQVPVITGTTGWHDELRQVKEKCMDKNGSLLYATNFSIGVNLLFELNNLLAKLMNSQTDYSVKISETHHIHKLDAPSGTAITLAEGIISNLDRKKHWKLDNGTSSNKDELLIESYREEEVIGDHMVAYENEIDKIELVHSAKNRKGFALGSVLAAEWIIDKKGVYQMKDLINSFIAE